MDRAESIQTLEELREACAEYGVKMSAAEEETFMAMKTSAGELSDRELEETVGGGGVPTISGRLIVTAFYGCPQITPPTADNCVSCKNSKYIFPFRVCMLS